jgi:integrase/recombinase XerD
MPKICRHGQAEVLSDQDCAKILKFLKNPKHRLFFAIACFTGERWGAITQLRILDVYTNPDRRELRKTICYRASTRKASPKGHRTTREVPIVPELALHLQAYSLPVPTGEWLFPDYRRPEKHMSFQNADHFLRAALDKAGLGGKGISTHSTRRTLVTKLAESGVALPVIQKITGHRSLQTLQRYVEVSDRQVFEALCRL